MDLLLIVKVCLFIFDKMVVKFAEVFLQNSHVVKQVRLPDRLIAQWVAKHPLLFYTIAVLIKHKLNRKWFVNCRKHELGVVLGPTVAYDIIADREVTKKRRYRENRKRRIKSEAAIRVQSHADIE